MKEIVSIYFSDTHFSNRPQDEYRWSLFPFLENLIRESGARYLFFLGDLTEQKDEHTGELVNRIFRNLRKLANALTENSQSNATIFMLSGNHCGLSADKSFFRFLHRGLMGKILYFSKPAEIGLFQQKYLFLPHTRDFSTYTRAYDFKKYDRVFFHQPIAGAVTENGDKLKDGIDASVFDGCPQAIGGDVHVPQVLGNARFVGAPHVLRYGDMFTPQVLIETAGKGDLRGVLVPGIRKAVVGCQNAAEFAALALRRGDMARVTVTLPRAQFGQWEDISREIQVYAEKRGIILGSLKLAEAVVRQRMRDITCVESRATTADPKMVLSTYAREKRIDRGLLKYADEVLK